jgi:hypothetical protein
MNILSLVSQNLDNFYQIQTKRYRNSDTVFFSSIHRTKRGLDIDIFSETVELHRKYLSLDVVLPRSDVEQASSSVFSGKPRQSRKVPIEVWLWADVQEHRYSRRYGVQPTLQYGVDQ